MPRAPDLAGCALDDRYVLHEVIGEGAFGRVYRGTDRRLGRAVAVKVIKPWWAEDSAWVERFQREARLLARLSDPGVVQIFDIGHADEGPYYVAELVEGESLADRMRSRPLSPREASTIAEQLCRSLAGAHREGIVHCDIKPANVLLGADGRVKVGDFGVARLAEGTSQVSSPTVAGTPRYMAPEQARGRIPTPATDVYSAGVVLYEMLAGHPPFQDGSPVELGLRHLEDPPPALPPSVPAPLRDVVKRALAKRPSERYRDGSEMAEALSTSCASARPLATSRAPRGKGGAGVPRTSGERNAAGAGDGPAQDAGAATALVRRRRLPRIASARPQTLAVEIEPVPGAESAATIARTRVLPGGRSEAFAGAARRRPPRRRRALAAGAGTLLLGACALAGLLLAEQGARTTVPELRGLPRAGVEARARRLRVSPTFSRRFDSAAAGVAIAQRPSPGVRVADDSRVDVVLSAGPPPVAVPGVVGEPAASAEGRIASSGLRYSVDSVPAPGSQAGVVVRQSPGGSGSIARGSTVALSVSQTPRWRPLTSFSGVDDGDSVAFRILGSRWRVTYEMAYRGTCELLFICDGPSAEVRNVDSDSKFGRFELEEGESETREFTSGPGLYRMVVAGGRDSARWSFTVQDYY